MKVALTTYKKLIKADACAAENKQNSLLEYEYCAGSLWSRMLALRRTHFGAAEAKKLFSKAKKVRFKGHRVFHWTDESLHGATSFFPFFF